MVISINHKTPVNTELGAKDFDQFGIKTLVQEMHQTLHTGAVTDFSSLNRFSQKNKNKYDPFGYDQKVNKPFVFKKMIYRKNCLIHKLIRIKKELQFVRSHLDEYQALTAREKEIIQLLAKGNNNPSIANRLYISRCTVEGHRKHINHKLNIHSFPFLMQYSYAFNLI